MNKSNLITLFGIESERRIKPSKLVREKRLLQYLFDDCDNLDQLGDKALQLPRYSLPITHFQCYLENIDPSYYYLALTGSIVGLSIDPAFAPAADIPNSTLDFSTPYPKAQHFPLLLNHLPICENVGIGIIHSINLRENTVTILTTLETEEMEKVNTLIRSTEPIPSVILRNVRDEK